MNRFLVILLLIFSIVTSFFFFMSWVQLPEGHRYIYPLDDVYIHLSLARNFAEHGVWSINTTGFDSASSSILYTLLLSGLIKIFGDWEYYPLLINIFFGYLTIYAAFRYFKDFYGVAEMKWLIVLLLPFSLVYFMTLIGMEHTIHQFLMVLAVYFIHKNVKNSFQKKDFIILLVIVFFNSIVRFESMFFTVSLAFALFLRKQFFKGVSVVLVGFFAIVVFGIISIQNGGYFFPNSVMIKGSFPAGDHFLASTWQLVLDGIFLNSSFYKCLFFPFLLLFIYLIKKYKGLGSKKFLVNETLIITIVATAILHSLFASLKYRYENYLMISILLLIIPVIVSETKGLKTQDFKLGLSKLISVCSIVVIVLVSIYRFGYHYLPLKMASKGIKEQQVEMSRFLGKYYAGEKVVANDIGSIAYFSHVKLLDIVGLGSTDIADAIVVNKHRARAEYNKNIKNYINQYVSKHDYKVAVIYPEWFPGGVPSNWIPVASWMINEKSYGPARKGVVFYALKPEEVPILQKNLMDFDLDKNVERRFYKTQEK